MKRSRFYALIPTSAAFAFSLAFGTTATASGQLLQQQSPGLLEQDRPVATLATGTCSTKSLAFTFRTGNDDLRGGQDNLDIQIHYGDGSMQTAQNVNHGANWPNNSVKTVNVPLTHPVAPAQIKSFTLIHGAQGGFNPTLKLNAGAVPDPILSTVSGITSEDNWDMASMQVSAVVSGGNTPIADAGFNRFTGSKPSLDVNAHSGVGCPNPNSVTELEFIFKTGDDDLRGGNDNLNITVLGDNFSQVVTNANQSANWGNNSTHEVAMQLNKLITVQQLHQVLLDTTFGGGSGGDNWNMQSLQIIARVNGANQVIANQGFNRFTGPPGNHLQVTLK